MARPAESSLEIGIGRRARRAYGFDEVALVPGQVTLNPDEVDISFALPGVTLSIPFWGSAMDGVVDVAFAIAMGKLGGLAVLNLDGVHTRYEDPGPVIERIAAAAKAEVNQVLKDAYRAPVRRDLIERRIRQIKDAGVPCAVSTIPARAEERAGPIEAAGADVLVVQGTVLTARHRSRSYHQLSFQELCQSISIPVLAGNCVQYDTALELMETGVAGILVGVGPGAACTTRGVLGVGVPQVTATADVAAAREEFQARWGRRVAVITDGGMRIGADVCKAFAAGADAVMIGSPLAGAVESASRGFNWGMATPDPNLPRGTRIEVGVKASLQAILTGPAAVDDGTQNFAGALRSCLGVCGAPDIREFQKVDMVIAPAIGSEGKLHQAAQGVGMGSRR
ncbi:MAG: GuaB3 family IMP dehydrogenase-related protein [Candidatus Dormibacter sp.]|uniref:GuaB3 family IMP dehydrogenase-related protein n=1 Tax=Candidatus Dormibacter sp. TaxID=2973982 RepID=UPI000DAFF086|nr:MAG: GuaB3 family IMP dehydrogenase-related protein [Candidatus Dormibacteraeota bacterium]